MALATLLGTLAFGAAGAGTVAAASATRHASISVATNPAAAANVRPGSSFTDTMTVSNQGDDPAKDVALQVTFDPAVVQLQSVQFNRDGAWVTATMANGFQASLGRLGTKGDSVSVTANFVALAGYPAGAPLESQLDVSWRDTSTDSGHHNDSNAPMLAGMSGQPSTTAATPSNGVVTVTGAGFQPAEAVTFWYNLPSGTAAPLYLRHDQLVTDKTHKERSHNMDENKDNATALYADASGQISTSFATAGLAAGAYSIVAHGVSSGLNVVIPFMTN
jgi:hypothetical protein